MIAAALSMISGVAMSKERSTHCNALDAGPMYNKVELSEKDKCWLNHWKEDDTAGTLGSIFWMRLGDGFVSMPVKDLRMAGSEKAAKKVIMTEVVDAVVIEAEAQLIGVAQTMHDAVVAERDRLIAALGTTPGDVSAAVAKIGALTDEIDDIKAALTRFGPVETTTGRLQRITDIANDLRAANSDAFFAARRIANAIVTANNIDGYSDSDLFYYQDLRGDANYDNALPAAESTPADGISIFHSDLAVRDANGDLIGSIGTDATFLATVDFDTLEQIVTDAFNEGYNSGWNDGYDSGYADGYRDGFRDGVNSARGQ